MSLLRVALLWGPPAAWMVLLLWLSSQSDLDPVIRGKDYLLHAGAYAVLGSLSVRAFQGGWSRVDKRPALLALALAGGHGLVEEIYQSFVPGRHPSFTDWVADVVGAGAAILALRVWTGWRRRARTTKRQTG